MSRKDITQPYWRPDFKIESTLPDIKTVRTNFAVNFIVLMLVLIVTTLLMQREYQSHLLRRTISDLEQQVQAVKSEDTSRLKKSGQFRKLARNIQELQRFFQAPFFAHEPMVELALLKPEELTFSRVVLTESLTKVEGGKKAKTKPQVAFDIDITGNVQDLPVLTEFKRMLEESSLLNPPGFKINIDESIQQRDVDTGIIPFQVSISLIRGTTSDKGANK